jgi:hypothetical protein
MKENNLAYYKHELITAVKGIGPSAQCCKIFVPNLQIFVKS